MLIEHSLLIHAPADSVYRTSQDYAVRYEWDPFPEHIAQLGSGPLQVGSKVTVKAKSGLSMTVEFVQFQPPTVAAINMVEGPVFLRKFAGSWSFRSEGDAATLVRFRYNLKMQRWALPVLTERLAAFYFQHQVKRRLQGLKRYCEQQATKPAIAAGIAL
jgi:hypothetical protein